MKKVIVWGMGNTYQHWREWFYQVEIVAFINDSRDNTWLEFEGKPVISSQEVKNYEFDSIIVVVANISNIYPAMQKLVQQKVRIEILSYKERICEIDQRRKKISVSFNNLPNVGDQLNSYLIDNLFNVEVVLAPANVAQVMAVGSILEELCVSRNVLCAEENPITVWGTGFITDHREQLNFIRKVNVCALRGEKSKAIVEKIMGEKIKCVLADPGLLVSKIYSQEEKKYDIGIVPHYVDINNPAMKKALLHYKNSILIDVTENPSEVIRKITRCRNIISSSLHGLIIADSFGIPNQWVKCSEKIIGDSFKYEDYYSAFGKQRGAIDISKRYPSIREIENSYCIDIHDVHEKQKQLMQCFPL